VEARYAPDGKGSVLLLANLQTEHERNALETTFVFPDKLFLNK
jgi:hypothetical protein